jgi:hypothetical protein
MDRAPFSRRVFLVVAVFLAALVLVFGLIAGWLAGRLLPLRDADHPQIRDTDTLVREVQGLNQLVTVKYVLEKLVILEDARWYGENRVLLVAHGIAKAGVDLSKLKPGDVSLNGSTISLKLPKPQLLDVYLDDRKTEVIERSTGLLRSFDKDLEQDARRQAVDRIRAAAYESGILKEADDRAQTQLADFFRRMGFHDVQLQRR